MKRSRPAAAPAEIAGIGKHSLVWTRAGRNAFASIEDDFSAKFKWPALLVAVSAMGQKPTSPISFVMSASCQKQTLMP